MSFDKVQDEIIDLLSDDSEQQFIFLTGAAGTGKTTLLERVKNQLSLKKMVVASTGIAALNIGGTTINSAFRIGFETIPLITKSKDPRFGKLKKEFEKFSGSTEDLMKKVDALQKSVNDYSTRERQMERAIDSMDKLDS